MAKRARPSTWRTALSGLLVCFLLGAEGWSQTTTSADIYYDSSMVPHIFGEDDEAAMYGLGWHHMMEYPIGTLNSLWHTSGMSASVWGPAYLDEDRVIHQWDVPAIADRHEMEMDSHYVDMLEAYVAGVEAGRAWWADGDATMSARLRRLLDPDDDVASDPTERRWEVAVDPSPDYVNQSFAPYATAGFENHNPFDTWDDVPQVSDAIRATVERMFEVGDPAVEITVDHVLRLGVAVNSAFLLRSNNDPVDVFGNKKDDSEELASNGWMISPEMGSQNVVTLSDGHVGFNRLAIRPYFVQVDGDVYKASGITIPGYPALYVGFNDWVSWMITGRGCATVWRNRWEVTLEADLPLRFMYTPSVGSPEAVMLEEVTQSLDCYDAVDLASTVPAPSFQHYYVPKHASEPAELGFDRYAVVTKDTVSPGDTITFQQAAFADEGSPWAFLFAMGSARNADADFDAAIAAGQVLFGGGLNFQVADRDSLFRYRFMARIPVQGTGVAPADYKIRADLDGSTHTNRWQGYAAVPSIPPAGDPPADTSAAQEAWIINNPTADQVETSRFDETDLATFPLYVCSQSPGAASQSSTTWRQERADEVLRSQLGTLDLADSEEVALDMTDNWMRRHWPLFQILRGDTNHDGEVGTSELPFSAYVAHPARLTRIDPFMDWLEAYRSHDESDVANPAYDFVAHRFSRVTVYGTLLRSLYLSDHISNQIVEAYTTTDQETLGVDPQHAALDDPDTVFVEEDFEANVAAMVQALATTSKLWKKGSNRLANQIVLDGSAWSDAMYSSPIEAPWDDIIQGPLETRWGRVNVLVETPHSLPNPRKRFGGKAMLLNGTISTPDIVQGQVYLDIDPASLASLPLDPFGQVPFYVEQTPRVRPVGGVRTALFTANNGRLFVFKAKDVELDEFEVPIVRTGYLNSLYTWDPDALPGRFLYYHPLTSGSQTLLSVQLHPTLAATAKCLTALGGTEITSDVTVVTGSGDIDLSYQDRYAPMDDFATGTWHDLLTDETAVSTMFGPVTHSVSYTRP